MNTPIAITNDHTLYPSIQFPRADATVLKRERCKN